jgi:hypothetical protein
MMETTTEYFTLYLNGEEVAGETDAERIAVMAQDQVEQYSTELAEVYSPSGELVFSIGITQYGMIETTVDKIFSSYPEPKPKKIHTGAEKRQIRGLKLYLERKDEIVDMGNGFYSIPGSKGSYTVHLGEEHDTCSCPDYYRLMQLPGPTMACKHITCAVIYRAKNL